MKVYTSCLLLFDKLLAHLMSNISVLKYNQNRRSPTRFITGWPPRPGYPPVVHASHLEVLLLSTPPAAPPEASTSRNQLADTSINCASESRASPRLHKPWDAGSAIRHFNQVFTDWCDVHDLLNQGVTGYLPADLFWPQPPSAPVPPMDCPQENERIHQALPRETGHCCDEGVSAAAGPTPHAD